MSKAKTLIIIALAGFASSIGAETRLSDAQVIEQITVANSVIHASFVQCTDERLVRKWHKDRERFSYSAKCTLKVPEDVCERQRILASGDIEGSLVTVYDIRLHLLCQD